MVALIRHADAGKRGGGPSDHLRPLTERGFAQAQGLVELLRDVRLSRVLSSPYVRCRQTVEPLAAARALPIEDREELAEGAGPDPTLKLVLELADAGAALCSHGDVIGAVLDRLAAAGVVSPGRVRFEKGSTWLLEVTGDRITAARYLPPAA
jgi:8-oxo-dGTP diphosphatase